MTQLYCFKGYRVPCCLFYSFCYKIVASLLFFYMHVNKPSLRHFRFKILLYFAHADEAKRANLHG